MKLRKYSLNQLKIAVLSSTSYREVLKKLSIKAAGGNYATLKKALVFYNLDVSHFTGRAWNTGNQGKRKSLESYLNNQQEIQSNKLRLRLLRDGIFEPICSSCKLRDWLSVPIPLELDHKDGNPRNNNLDNLRLLCPNCHALTPTYRGKNIRKLSSVLPSA